MKVAALPARSDLMVTTVRNVLGDIEKEVWSVPWRGQTLRELAASVAPWDAPLAVIVDGERQKDLEQPCRPGSTVLVCPAVQGGLLVTLIIGIVVALISAAVTRQQVKGALSGLDNSQDRGDNKSQTYGWDGIATDYGPGAVIPLVYGEHDVGGTVVNTQVLADPQSGTEILVQDLVLGHGRFDSIGGLQGDAAGEADDLGYLPNPFADVQGTGQPLPDNFRVNGNLLDTAPGAAGATVSFRLGTDSQRPFPNSQGSFTTEAVGIPLEDINQEGTVTITSETVSLVNVSLRFPGGLFSVDQSGNPVALQRRFRLEYRSTGGGWIQASQVLVFLPNTGYTTQPTPNGEVTVDGRTDRVPFTAQFGIDVSALTAPVEVRVTRLDPRGGTSDVDGCQWTNVSYKTGPAISYSGLACVSVALRANEKFYGSQPQFQIRCRGSRIRCWDATNGWSPRTWDVPAAPFDFHTHAVGRNPAWILADFLLHHQALGYYLTEDDLDLQSFRDLADYCDQEIAPGFPRYRFDGVLDQPQAAWDWARKILQVCDASIILRGRKLTVRYGFRDAHGTVPARATFENGAWRVHHQMLFSAVNASEITTTYVDRSKNPSVFDMEILNEALDYERDPVTQSDPDALGLADPVTVLDGVGVRREPWNVFGITRAGQARYLALLAFKANRFADTAAKFKAGPAGMALEPGDLIGVQTDSVKPASRENFGLRLHRDQETGVVSALRFDRDLVVPAGETWAVFVLLEDDGADSGFTVAEVWIAPDMSERTFYAGDQVPIHEPAAGGAATTLDLGTEMANHVVSVGPTGSAVKSYEVTELTLTEDLELEVTAVEWHPEMHDVDLDLLAGEGEGAGFGEERRDLASSPGGSAETQQPVTVRVTPDKDPRRQVIQWETPAGQGQRRARVFMRTRGALQWRLLAEVAGNTVTTSEIPPGRPVDVSVALQNPLTGGFPNADEATVAQVTPDEFPALSVPSVGQLEASGTSEGVFLTWQRFDAAQGIDHYEIRFGQHWMDARVVGMTEAPHFVDTAANWVVNGGGGNYLVRARHRNGLYSQRVARATLLVEPPGDVLDVSESLAEFEGAPPLPGTAVQMTFDGDEGVLLLEGDHLNGTYETQWFDPGYETSWWWSFMVEHDGLHLAKLEDLTFPLDSGEARWWTLRGREASPRRRAPAFQPVLSDLAAVTLDDLRPGGPAGELQAAGPAGAVGRHTDVRLEVRFEDETEAQTPWMPYSGPVRFTARKAQLRLRCDRSSRDRVLTIRRIDLFAGIQT